MNITELLFEYLKQGKTADIPGIGSFAARLVNAHYDASTQTFFPTQQRIEFSPRTIGDNGIVHYIAQKDCVSDAIGERTWRNYVETLKAKLDKEGSIQLSNLGTLSKADGIVCFAPAEGLNSENPLMKSVQGVKTYAVPTQNPFDRIGQKPVEVPADVVAEMPAAEPQTEPEVQEPEVASSQSEPKVDGSPVEESPLVEVPATAGAEAPVVPDPVRDEESIVPTPADPIATQHATALESPFEPEVPAAPEAPAEPVAPVVIEQPNAPTGPIAETTESADTLKGLKELEEMQRDTDTVIDDAFKGKKKSQAWIWISLVVLILLLLGGGYYYGSQVNPSFMNGLLSGQKQPTDQAKEIDVEQMVSNNDVSTTAEIDGPESGEMYGNTNNEEIDPDGEMTTNEEETEVLAAESTEATSNTTEEGTAEESTTAQTEATQKNDTPDNTNMFTYSTDGITFDAAEIDNASNEVMKVLDQYLESYAAAKHYSKASAALKEKVREHVSQRLNEKMGANNEFLVQNLIPYSDYVRDYNMPALKNRKANRQKVLVQTEVIESGVLSQLLDDAIEESGIEADKLKVTATPKAKNNYVEKAQYSNTSKKGYDIIAGFFVNKSNADRMASNLKSKGCDAYVIQYTQGYYVSMGSAESRTKAEALYTHIKEWYKGDITIKKF